MLGDLVTIEGAADIIGTTVWTVRRLYKKGAIKSVGRDKSAHGAPLQFRRADMEAFAAKTRPPASPTVKTTKKRKYVQRSKLPKNAAPSEPDTPLSVIRFSPELEKMIFEASKAYCDNMEGTIRRYVIDGLIRDKFISLGT